MRRTALWTRFLLATALLAAGTSTALCAPATPPLSDTHDLEAFCDGVIVTQLRQYHCPGAVVAVVQGDRVLLAKGYGYGDLERRIPVSADRTMFRVGSISKLFTWTAAMQLVEQGRVDLHADVNRYLKGVRVRADGWRAPVTMADLMSHSAGFEDRVAGLVPADAKHLRPMKEILAHSMPVRVRPPGQYSAYSNHGACLAGQVVEDVSGEPFGRYVERHIFAPLGMRHSTFDQPPPPRQRRFLSQGYVNAGGVPKPGGFEWISGPPAGSLCASATDMTRFMIAHLHDGGIGPARILRPSTARLMHSHLFTQWPGCSGWAHGFMEATLNGRQAIHHAGDVEFFHSEMLLLPKEQAGIFMSYNGAGAGAASLELLQYWMDRYFPATARPPRAMPHPDPARFAGCYAANRRSYTTFERIAALFMQTRLRVDGKLLRTDQPGLGAQRWVQVAPLAFEPAAGEPNIMGGLRFRQEHGRITHCFVVNNPTEALERLPWYDAMGTNTVFLVGAMLLQLSAVVGWPLGWLLKRKSASPATGAGPRWARRAAWGASALQLACVLGVGAVCAQPLMLLNNGRPPLFLASLGLGVAGTALAVAAGILLVPAWERRWWRGWVRLHYSLVSLAGLALALWLYHWNLLGFRLP